MKPDWLKVRIEGNCHEVERHLDGLNTVCKEALCPNRFECYNRKTATFLLLGTICTRDCKYCNILAGNPEPVDKQEPMKVAVAIKKLGLKHAVLTMVTRDDLEDQGAGHIIMTIDLIRELSDTTVEVLISDMDIDNVDKIIAASPDVINHNIEVTKSHFSGLRPHGSYSKSLEIIHHVHKQGLFTKSGMMIGFGESMEEIEDTISDLAGIDCLTVGQYLQPSSGHAEVKKYYSPHEFNTIKEMAKDMGIEHIEAGPFVRSSYHADLIIEKHFSKV